VGGTCSSHRKEKEYIRNIRRESLEPRVVMLAVRQWNVSGPERIRTNTLVRNGHEIMRQRVASGVKVCGI
jgi:hypothetical protein